MRPVGKKTSCRGEQACSFVQRFWCMQVVPNPLGLINKVRSISTQPSEQSSLGSWSSPKRRAVPHCSVWSGSSCWRCRAPTAEMAVAVLQKNSAPGGVCYPQPCGQHAGTLASPYVSTPVRGQPPEAAWVVKMGPRLRCEARGLGNLYAAPLAVERGRSEPLRIAVPEMRMGSESQPPSRSSPYRAGR